MTYRLAQQSPVLALPLSSLDPERQVVVARAAAEVAVEASGVSIPTTEAGALTALVEALDTVAWDLQDEGNERYPSAFAQARAANAVLFTVQGEPAEAVYEAVAALGDDATVLAIIEAG